MKKLIASAAALLLVAGSLSAQERTEETTTTTDSTGTHTVQVVRVAKTEDIRVLKNMVMVDPIKFIGIFNASYYRAITPSIAVGGTIQTPTNVIDDDISGFGLQGDVLFYPTGKTFRGFHIGGKASYDAVSYTSFEINGPVDRTDHPFSIGTYIGWNWWPFDELATELGLGAQYNISVVEDDNLFFYNSKKGVSPYGFFRVGYAW